MSDLLELGKKYAELKSQLDAIEAQLVDASLAEGKTLSLGSVEVKFTKGRKTYDYETPGKLAPLSIIEACTVEKVDWKRVCTASAIEPGITKVGEPSAKVKVK